MWKKAGRGNDRNTAKLPFPLKKHQVRWNEPNSKLILLMRPRLISSSIRTHFIFMTDGSLHKSIRFDVHQSVCVCKILCLWDLARLSQQQISWAGKSFCQFLGLIWIYIFFFAGSFFWNPKKNIIYFPFNFLVRFHLTQWTNLKFEGEINVMYEIPSDMRLTLTVVNAIELDYLHSIVSFSFEIIFILFDAKKVLACMVAMCIISELEYFSNSKMMFIIYLLFCCQVNESVCEMMMRGYYSNEA